MTTISRKKSRRSASIAPPNSDYSSPELAKQLAELQYPPVVKLCQGEASLGVMKVSDETSLREAVAMLGQDTRLAEHGIIVETYVPGPELDANFVLLDGAVLFLEVTDNFPCLGDDGSATLVANFAEKLQISNTRLPTCGCRRTSLSGFTR